MKLLLAVLMVLGLAQAASATDIRADFHAVGDGVHDDTDAFRAAAAAGGDVVISKPPVCYRITGQVDITRPGSWRGANGACIKPDIGLGRAMLFCIDTSHFHLSGLAVSGAGLTFAPATGTHVAFMVGCNGSGLSGIELDHNRVSNWQFAGEGTYKTNLNVSHAFYVQNASDVSIHDNAVTRSSGACVFFQNVSRIAVNRNRCIANAWYPINCYSSCTGFEIGRNVVVGDRTNNVYWGGGINIMSQPPQPPSRDGSIHDNDLSGYYGYGGVIHVASAIGVKIVRNRIHDWDIGPNTGDPDHVSAIVAETRGIFAATLAASDGIAPDYLGPVETAPNPALTVGRAYPVLIDREWALAVYDDATHMTLKRRGFMGTAPAAHAGGAQISSQNGPVSQLTIARNDLFPTLTPHATTVGIQIANPVQVRTNPGTDIAITGNHFRAGQGRAFSIAIVLNGQDGGLDRVQIQNNDIVTAKPASGPAAVAIATTASSPGGVIRHLSIAGNTLRDISGDVGERIGMDLDSVDDVQLGANTIDGYRLPVRLSRRSGKNIAVSPQTVQRAGPAAAAVTDNRNP